MQEWINGVLESSQLAWAAFPAAFVLGILGSVGSFCNLAAIGAVAGYSATRDHAGRRATLLAALSFMVGTIVALTALGATAGFVSQVAGTALGRYWKVFAGLVAIFFGLAALNMVPLKVPVLAFKSAAGGGGLIRAAMFGLVMGGSATACSAWCSPVLAVPVALAALHGRTLWGAGILGAFAVGFSLPLAVAVLGLSLGKSALRARKAATVVRIAGGVLLVGVGFYLLIAV